MIALVLSGCGTPPELDCPDGGEVQVDQDGQARLVSCVLDGVLHGPRKRTLDERPLWVEHYRNGKLHGVRELYDRSLRVSEITYADGLRSGSALGRHPNGAPMYEGHFDAGKADGEWFFYASDRPEAVARVVFEAGAPIRAGVDALVSLERLSVPLSAVARDGSEVVVGERRFTGPIPMADGHFLCQAERLELAVWTEKSRIVGLRGCGETCGEWALTPAFAAAGTLIPTCE